MAYENNEADLALKLRQERASTTNKEAAPEMPQETIDELTAAASNKNKFVMFFLSIFLKALSDLADWFAIPSLPIIGDILDVVTGGISVFSYLSLSGVARRKGIVRSIGSSLFELLPFVVTDLVPTYVIEGIWTWHTTKKMAKKAEGELGQIKNGGV